MNDLIIGASCNLPAADLRPWAASARASGFMGRIVLLSYATDDAASDQLQAELLAYGVEVVRQPWDASWKPSSVMMRRLADYSHPGLGQLLFTGRPLPRYVIATDVRDLIFQTDPSEWLSANEHIEILAPEESVPIEFEPWSTGMFQAIFPHLYWRLRNQRVINAGSYAVKGWDLFREVTGRVHQAIHHVPATGCDQTALHALLATELREKTTRVPERLGWAVQLHPWARTALEHHRTGAEPVITAKGVVMAETGKPFVIVHQYDRFIRLREMIRARYG